VLPRAPRQQQRAPTAPAAGRQARSNPSSVAAEPAAPRNTAASSALSPEDEQDAEAAALELEALESIYGGNGVWLEAVSPREWRFRLDCGSTLEVFLPRGYPTRAPPTPVLHSPWLDAEATAAMVRRLLQLHAGAEVVFEWVEALREELGNRLACEMGTHLAGEVTVELGGAFGALGLRGCDGAAGERSEACCGGGGPGPSDSGGASFEPSSVAYGQRARKLDDETTNAANAVEVIHGEPFTPPGKSVRHRRPPALDAAPTRYIYIYIYIYIYSTPAQQSATLGRLSLVFGTFFAQVFFPRARLHLQSAHAHIYLSVYILCTYIYMHTYIYVYMYICILHKSTD